MHANSLLRQSNHPLKPTAPIPLSSSLKCYAVPAYSEKGPTMSAPQSYKNHGRFDPPIHFFVFPVLLINFIVTITIAIHHWHHHRNLHLWWIVVAAALVVLATKSRINDLKVQDRIIRLEETLRLASLLPRQRLRPRPGARHQADHRPPLRLRRRTSRPRPQDHHPGPRTQSHQTKHRQLARRQPPRLATGKLPRNSHATLATTPHHSMRYK